MVLAVGAPAGVLPRDIGDAGDAGPVNNVANPLGNSNIGAVPNIDIGSIPNFGIGGGPRGSASAGNLPYVADPDETYAQITRNEYLDYVNNYRDFEDQLINQAQTDTSLIDQARDDVTIAQGIARGVSDRNSQRYGASLTPAQLQQRDAVLQRENTLGGIKSVSDARIAQREANTRLLSDLINIGQGVNRSSLNQLGSAAADATGRKNAYESARAQSRAQTYSTIGSLGAMAIMAFAF
jgi:hypothetical protein